MRSVYKSYTLPALLCASTLAAAECLPFKVMDSAVENLPKVRMKFSDQITFPNAPAGQQELQQGFRISEIDFNTNWGKALEYPNSELDLQMDLITARGEYTIGCFSIFAYKDISQLEVIPSALQDDAGNTIAVSEIKLQEYSARGTVPRFQYTQMFYNPALNDLKANEQINLAMLVNVPADTPGGLYCGKVLVRTPQGSETLNVSLRVGDFTLKQVGSFGFYYSGNLYRKIEPNDPYRRQDEFDRNQKKLTGENLNRYFAFLKSRRFNSISLYDHISDLRYVDGKVTGYFADGAAWAQAMKAHGMTGYMMYDLRDIGYWANAVAQKLEQLGGQAPAGDLGITMRNRKVEAKNHYSEKAKEIYGEAIKLLLKQAKEENWPELRIFADEELGNIAMHGYLFKKLNYDSYMPVIMQIAPGNAVVIDNTIGYGRSDEVDRGSRDKVQLRQYNSWTDKALADAWNDQAEIMSFNYGPWRMQCGFLQIRLKGSGHHQWADMWDAPNFQWQYNLLTDKGVMTSIGTERMHEGIVDYAACRYLAELIEQCKDKKLVKYARKVLQTVSQDIPVEHHPAQLYALAASNANLNNRRIMVFQAIELLSKGAVNGTIVPGKPSLEIIKEERRALPKNDYVIKVKNTLQGTIVPAAAASENFWSSVIGPLKFLTEYENQLLARSSSLEEFNRLNIPSYAIGQLASLPEGLAIVTRGNNVMPRPPYRCSRQDDDGDMWTDDCFEVFFALPNGPQCTLAYNAAGKKVFFRNGRIIPAKDIKSYVLSPVHQGGGTVNKLLIPWRYFGLKAQPMPGTVWEFNLARELHTLRGPKEALSSWARLASSFHEREKWGRLVFTGSDGQSSVKTPATLMVTQNTDNLVLSGDPVKFYYEANSGSDGSELKLTAKLKHQSGRTRTMPVTVLPGASGYIVIDTTGLNAGEWTLLPALKNASLQKSNQVKFIVLPSPFVE